MLMDANYTVYVKTDASGNITAVNSSAFLPDTAGWVQVDVGMGDRYHHAQGHYFDAPIVTESGVFRYKLNSGVPVEKTAQEITAEESATAQIPTPTDAERISALESAVLDMVMGV